MSFIDTIAGTAAAALRAIGLGKETERDDAKMARLAAPYTGTQPESVLLDEPEPIRWGRAERRRHLRTLKSRDRNTDFSKRSKVFSAKRLHADANNKVLNYLNHTLLHELFGRANLYPKEQA